MLPEELQEELMSCIRKMPFEDFMLLMKCIKILVDKNLDLENENFELCKRILKTNEFIKKIRKVSDYLNGIPCEDVLDLLNGKK